MNTGILFSLTFALLVLFAPLQAGEATSDLKPLISQAGELLFEDDFDAAEIRPEWVALHGTQWSVVDGALRGEPSTEEYQQKQIARDNKAHSGGTPSSRLMVATDDCIVQFRFKLSEGLKGAHFGFNDGSFKTGTGHVCRYIATTKDGLALQKDRNVKLEGDEDEILVRDEFNLNPECWYWMVLEIVGERMAVQISGGAPLQARNARFDIPKDQINLPTRGGGVIFYDSVRVWKALPVKK